MKTLSNNHRTGRITAVTRDQNAPAYDVQTNEGAIYRAIPIMMQGRSLFPPSVGDTVHLLFPRGKYDLPYIIASEPSTIAEQTPNAGGDADYTPDQRDLVLRQGTQTLSLSESGVSASGSIVRLQVTEKLRVSANGTSENGVLNADPFIAELYAYIAELETVINGLNLKLNAVVSQFSPAQQTVINAIPVSLPSSSTASKARAQATINATISIP
tara:strand:- start:757 stop:1398 length:642 start_codon:yes stop_codon:yes gene_type:complete